VRDQFGLRGAPGVSRLGVARRQHAGVADAGLGGVVQRLQHAGLRDHQVGHVDRLADVGARGHGGSAVRGRAAPVDQVGTIPEAELDQVAVGQQGERRLVRRADQGHAARAEQAG
jgi:hypothetical protein